MTAPWWLENAETGRRVKYADYETAKRAGIAAYHRKVAAGFYAEDSFYLLSGGEYLGVAALASK